MVRFEIGNVGSITFLSERSVLCFLLSLIGQSYCSYLSNWCKMDHQDLAVLHVDSDTAELRYLVCMAQMFALSFVRSFCNVFSLMSGKQKLTFSYTLIAIH